MSVDRLYRKIFHARDSSSNSGVVPREPGFLQLLKFEGNTIVLCPEGLEVIEQVQGAVGVVVIAGTAQSGKSSLLNLLLQKPLDNELRERTKGLWIYTNVVQKIEASVLAVELEGLEDSPLDTKLMAVLFAICSVFIYNSPGLIDESSMKKLRVLNDLPKLIEAQGRDPIALLARFAPRFIWSLRDFSLNLKDSQGRVISAKSYLDSVLETGRVQSDYSSQFSLLRERILNLFLERDCIRFPRPIEDDLNEVDMLGELSKQFLFQVDKLRTISVSQCPSKKIFEQVVNGPLLSSMLEFCVEAINSQGSIDYVKAWRQVKEKEYKKLFEDIKALYMQRRVLDVEAMPYSETELVMLLHEAKEKSVTSGLRKTFAEDRGLENRLLEDLESYFETDLKRTLEANLMTSIEYNSAVLDRVFLPILHRMDKGGYNDDIKRLEADWNTAAEEYEASARGPGRFHALNNFASKFQHERFAEFFKNMLAHYEKELQAVKRQCELTQEQRRTVDDQADKFKRDHDRYKELLEEMEGLIGVETSHDQTYQKLEAVIQWLKEREAHKKKLEEQIRLAEADPNEVTVELKLVKSQTGQKSCCSVF